MCVCVCVCVGGGGGGGGGGAEHHYNTKCLVKGLHSSGCNIGVAWHPRVKKHMAIIV